MTREQLIKSREYITSKIQLDLLDLIGNYKDKKKLKDYELASELGVSKGYVSQLLNATYDHKISKVVDLALACNAVPILRFVDMNAYLETDAKDQVYCLVPMQRPRNVVQTELEAIGATVESPKFTSLSGHRAQPISVSNAVKQTIHSSIA